MIKLRTISLALLSVMATVMTATDYTVSGQYVTIPVKKVKEGGAQVVRLQVVNDNIIRVQATPETSCRRNRVSSSSNKPRHPSSL